MKPTSYTLMSVENSKVYSAVQLLFIWHTPAEAPVVPYWSISAEYICTGSEVADIVKPAS